MVFVLYVSLTEISLHYFSVAAMLHIFRHGRHISLHFEIQNLFDHFWLAFVALTFDGSTSCLTIFICIRSMQLHTLCNILLYFVILAQYNLNIFSINKSRRYANYSIFALIIISIPLAISFLFMSSPHKWGDRSF